MPKKEYIVKLGCEERERLEVMLSKGKHSARLLTNIRILLKADVNQCGGSWKDMEICNALSLNKNRPEKIRKRFVEEGLERILTYKKRASPPIVRILDGEKEARLIQLACSSPPEGRCRWTLELLADKMVQLHIVDTISDSTIYRTLKKTSLSRISGNNG